MNTRAKTRSQESVPNSENLRKNTGKDIFKGSAQKLKKSRSEVRNQENSKSLENAITEVVLVKVDCSTSSPWREIKQITLF